MKDEKTEILENALAKMREIAKNGDDIENDHYAADAILCEVLEKLGFKELVDVWDGIHKWYA